MHHPLRCRRFRTATTHKDLRRGFRSERRAIAHASVEFAANGNTIRTETDAAGNFTVLSAQPYGTLSVSSPGFSTIKFDITTASEPLRIRLEPAAVIERILVTDDDERIPSTPASQFALSQQEISSGWCAHAR